MRRIGATLLLALAGVACKLTAVNPTPAPRFEPSDVPSPQSTAALPLFFDSIDMMDSQSGWAWRGISQLYRTDDGAATWHEVHLQGRMQVTGASFLDGQEAWLPGVPDADVQQPVFHTLNGGMTWSKLGSLPGPNLELHFHDAHLGWALNGMGAAGNIFYRAYQTTDGGQTWSRLEVTGPGGADSGAMAGSIHIMTGDSLAFMPPSMIWIASGFGIATPYAGLKLSQDGGRTWQDLNPVLPADLGNGHTPVITSPPQFVTDQDAFLPVRVGDREVFFASHDAGASWSLLPPVLPAGRMMASAQFVNLTDGFTTCGAELCATQDGGKSWQSIAAPFPFGPAGGDAFISQFDFVDGVTGWGMLMDQQGNAALLKTTDGGHTWIRLQPRLGF
jgi:photosystem II stability/assembly factor-like uncharacterized protein